MQTFLTNDLIEARACRRAQFAGWIAALSIGGVAVTGIVHSVQESDQPLPKHWIIKVRLKAMSAARADRRSFVAR